MWGRRTGQPQTGTDGIDECLHRVYRTMHKVCMLHPYTLHVFVWLIQTSHIVRSNLHSTIHDNRKLAFYCTCDPTGARLRLTLGMIEGGVDTLLVLFCIVCL